jgi:hypothetical protein
MTKVELEDYRVDEMAASVGGWWVSIPLAAEHEGPRGGKAPADAPCGFFTAEMYVNAHSGFYCRNRD